MSNIYTHTHTQIHIHTYILKIIFTFLEDYLSVNANDALFN